MPLIKWPVCTGCFLPANGVRRVPTAVGHLSYSFLLARRCGGERGREGAKERGGGGSGRVRLFTLQV